MGLSELRDKQADLLVRKSKLQRDLRGRKDLEAGIFYVDGDQTFLPARTAIEADLRRVENDLTDLESALFPASSSSAPKGRLQEAIGDWAKAQGFKKNVSVPSIKIAKFVRNNSDKFSNLSDGSVRSTLSRLGYSAEKNS